MYRKFCIRFLSAALALVLLVAGSIFIIDPFSHYRVPVKLSDIIYINADFQNPGIARHAEYDTLITGSSMTQNFRANWFDSAFGCSAVRLSYSGATANLFVELIDNACMNNKPKTVYLSIDNYILTGKREKRDIERYLYDNNPFNDVKYLLNKDVFFAEQKNWFFNRIDDDYDFYDACSWDGEYEFSKENALKTYERCGVSEDAVPDDSFMKISEETVRSLVGVFANNPDIEFVIFAPPYSILYWDGVYRAGELDATLNALSYAYKELLQCGNVTLYYFQNLSGIIDNLDLYKDQSHYCPDVNKYMIECFTMGKFKVESRNVDEVLEGMRQTVLTTDFDAIFPQTTKSPSQSEGDINIAGDMTESQKTEGTTDKETATD